MNKEKRKTVFRILYIIGTVALIALIGIWDKGFKEAAAALKSINCFFVLVGFGSILMFWLTDGLLLHHITGYVYGKLPFRNSLKAGIIGLYYGAITPCATGGQPMQVVYMNRERISYGTSTCIVVVKFIVYEISLCLFYVVAMLLRGAYFFNNFKQIFWITTIGFLINLASVAFVAFVMVNQNIPYKITHGILRFLIKIKIVKSPLKAYATINKTINEFSDGTEIIKKHKTKVIVSVIISVLNLIFLFSIPYFIYIAFGYRQKNIIDLITMQSFLSLAVSFFPLPGASGASEGGFYLFFSSYFTKTSAFMPMLIWRFISYYSIVIIGAFVIVIDEVITIKRKKSKEKTGNIIIKKLNMYSGNSFCIKK